MPLREYQCEECVHTFESYNALSTPAKTRPCPQCGKPAKLITYSKPAKRNPDHGIQR